MRNDELDECYALVLPSYGHHMCTVFPADSSYLSLANEKHIMSMHMH